jgi:signal peptidase I
VTGSTDAADTPRRSPENAGSDARGTDTAAAPAEASKPPKRKHGALRTVVIVMAILVVLLVVLYTLMLTFVARSYLIPSEAMAPTVQVGDHIIVDKLTYRFRSPQPGDVIVFKGPPNWNVGYKSIRSKNPPVRWLQNALSFIGFVPPDENDLVKRVIAVGGQTVECRVATGLTVNGKPLNQPFLDPKTLGVDPSVYPCLGPEFGRPVAVPQDRLWVMGDNRTHSADSRAHCTSLPIDLQRGILCTGDPMSGTVPVDNVIGKARWRPWHHGNSNSPPPNASPPTIPTTEVPQSSGPGTAVLPPFNPPAGLGENCTYSPSRDPAARQVIPPRSGKVPTDPATVSAMMVTDQGSIGIQLDNAKAPCTVNNFVSLAQKGFYDDTQCHRLTTGPSLSVLQCGDPKGDGTGGPGYQFADEYPKNQYAPNDPALQQPVLYPRGTVAMANAGPGTNGSQFFLVYKDSELPPDYTVFGSTNDTGLATLDKIVAAGTADGTIDGRPATPITIRSIRLV